MMKTSRILTLLASSVAFGCASGGSAPVEKPVATIRGKASYYHSSLSGKLTANGEVYDERKLTAAHRRLPFCSRVRVVRLDTSESVIVRINDRGPFGDRRRILDLSRAAAEELDMLDAGVVAVRAEIVELGDGCTFHQRR